MKIGDKYSVEDVGVGKMKIRIIRGPWVSLGIHLDFLHKHIDVHLLWWVFVIGNTVDPIYCGYCEAELSDGDICPVCKFEYE